MVDSTKEFTIEEVAKHATIGDLWIVVDSVVYDLSKFASIHPGGRSVLLDETVAGTDATTAFFSLHRQEVLERPQYARLRVGIIAGTKRHVSRVIGSLSGVPYAEPTWSTQGFHSPYYTDSHRQYQKAVRKFVEEIVFPDAQLHEEDGKPPSRSVFEEMARVNLIAMRLGPGKHLNGRVLMEGVVKPEEFDQFHELILWQEFSRIHARGYGDGLGGGTCIGLPPVLNFGGEKLKGAIVEDILAGKKFICLAVSEAFAGSDVAGIKCSAKQRADGWIVNGTKKWITNGTWADYFTVACRNEDNGAIMVLVVPRGEGLSTKLIHTSYSTTAGTAFIKFDNVHVPNDNVITDNDGLRVVLSNFNHERWVLTAQNIGAQRIIVEECLKWVTQRSVFGKPLSAQAVIRSKLASMISRVESCQNWLENITYQMTHMSYAQQATELAGQIAFLKMYTTRAAQDTARDAVQIFGGRALTRSGMGKFIEHYHRTLLIDAVGGGAEDIMGDLGVRQALRKMPKDTRL